MTLIELALSLIAIALWTGGVAAAARALARSVDRAEESSRRADEALTKAKLALHAVEKLDDMHRATERSTVALRKDLDEYREAIGQKRSKRTL